MCVCTCVFILVSIRIKWNWLSQTNINKLTLEKMSRHHIQWLLAYNLLSYFVCTFKNVAEGYIHAKNANMSGAVQSL